MHASGEPVLEDPFGELPQVEYAMHRRQVHRGHATGQLVEGNDVTGIPVIAMVFQDEFHLIMRPKPLEVRPVISLRFSAAWALHVENGHDRCGNACGTAMPACFEQHRMPSVHQRLHERIDLILQERFSTGNFDERAIEATDLVQYLFDGPLATFMERVLRVTPRTPQVTCGQTDEYARATHIGRLPLNGIKDFVNRQQSSLLSVINRR